MSAEPFHGGRAPVRPLPPVCSPTDQWLKLLYEEARTLSEQMGRFLSMLEPASPPLADADAGVVVLQEPERRKGGWPKGKPRGPRT